MNETTMEEQDDSILLDESIPEPSTSSNNNSCLSNAVFFEPEPPSWSPESFSPAQLYQSKSYLIFRSIREAGSVGISRDEIAKRTGTTAKYLGRMWDTYTNKDKDLISMYKQSQGRQKRFCCVWKASMGENPMQKIIDDFARVSGGREITLGECVTFPDGNYSAMVLTDRAVQRLTMILEVLEERKIVVERHTLVKIMVAKEKEDGISTDIDRRTVIKLLLTLKNWGLVNIYTTKINDDGAEKDVAMICDRSISEDAEELTTALTDAKDKLATDRAIQMAKRSQYKCYPEPTAKRRKVAEHDFMHFLHPVIGPVADESAPTEPITVYDRLRLTRYVRVQEVPPEEEETKTEINSTIDEVISLGMSGQLTLPDDFDLTDGPSDLPSARPGPAKHPSNLTSDSEIFKSDVAVTEVTFDPHAAVRYGYQAKMVRFEIVHSWLSYLVYNYAGNGPRFFERFPPGTKMSQLEEKPLDMCHVYVDEESWKRFMPPLPAFSDIPHGWLMLQDLTWCMPLSIYVLIVQMQFKVPGLEEYLLDPIKRHILLMDLPWEIRRVLTKERRHLLQLRYQLVSLCMVGLVSMGANLGRKKIFNNAYDFFFVHNNGKLLDTSNAPVSYKTVPDEHYPKYEYNFGTPGDVELYWQHMRAIACSTAMGHRGARDGQPKETIMRVETARTELVGRKKFDEISPESDTPFYNGAGGTHPTLFIYRSLTWNVNPSPFCQWFLNDWRRRAARNEKTISQRINRLRPNWNSYMKSLAPNSSWLTIRRRQAGTNLTSLPQKIAENAKIWRGRIPQLSSRKLMSNRGLVVKRRNTKKRIPDAVDQRAQKAKMSIRSRFSSRERDMLIFLRAVSHFLYPVYRLWVNPTVLRDIMHDYVPESRDKTANSLNSMATRELNTKRWRLTRLQNLVRKMATMPELVAIRTRQEITNAMSDDKKSEIFMETFDMANKLMFKDSVSAPALDICSDSTLEEFLSQHELFIPGNEEGGEPSAELFWHVREPTDQKEVLSCTIFNSIFSQFALNSPDCSFMLTQFNDSLLSQVLKQLRMHGLITPLRASDAPLVRNTVAEHAVSFYFRHFFHHKYQPGLMRDGGNLHSKLSHGNRVNIVTDSAGYLVTAAALVSNDDVDFDLVLPDKIVRRIESESGPDDSTDDVLEQMRSQCLASAEEQRTGRPPKQGQELGELRLADCSLFLTPKTEDWKPAVSLSTAEQFLLKPYPLESAPFEDFLLSISVNQRPQLRALHAIMRAHGCLGVDLNEITRSLGGGDWWSWVTCLVENHQALEVGIVDQKYVAMECAEPWMVPSCKFSVSEEPTSSRFCPRAWLQPDGEVNRSMLCWMCEGLLCRILSQPGSTEESITEAVSNALQPRLCIQLLQFLKHIGCLERKVKRIQFNVIRGVFDTARSAKNVVCWFPTVNAVQIFGQVFANVPTPKFLAQTSGETAE